MNKTKLVCMECKKEYDVEIIYRCKCGGLFDVVIDYEIDYEKLDRKISRKLLDEKKFGVWRYKEIIHPLVSDNEIISRNEGNTPLYKHPKLSKYVGLENIILKHEGENPTGSFKDRGMTVGISEVIRQKARYVGCASTGNTASSLAAYAAMANINAIIFIPEGKIAVGKLAQILAYGAKVLQVKGNFDDAMIFAEKSAEFGIYLLNSINPWRIQGQETIIFELLEQLNWKAPDWIVLPAGNLGNAAAFGKAFSEAKKLDLTDKISKLALIQANGANPFYQTWKQNSSSLIEVKNPKTIASAINIGRPVNWKKALRSLKLCNGIVEQVSDEEIMDAKAIVDACGIGCEPASAASVAGAKKLYEKKIINKEEEVVCILTGNILKDPEAIISYHTSKSKYKNVPILVKNMKEIKKILDTN